MTRNELLKTALALSQGPEGRVPEQEPATKFTPRDWFAQREPEQKQERVERREREK